MPRIELYRPRLLYHWREPFRNGWTSGFCERTCRCYAFGQHNPTFAQKSDVHPFAISGRRSMSQQQAGLSGEPEEFFVY
jgi:hypothetical protein